MFKRITRTIFYVSQFRRMKQQKTIFNPISDIKKDVKEQQSNITKNQNSILLSQIQHQQHSSENIQNILTAFTKEGNIILTNTEKDLIILKSVFGMAISVNQSTLNLEDQLWFYMHLVAHLKSIPLYIEFLQALSPIEREARIGRLIENSGLCNADVGLLLINNVIGLVDPQKFKKELLLNLPQVQRCRWITSIDYLKNILTVLDSLPPKEAESLLDHVMVQQIFLLQKVLLNRDQYGNWIFYGQKIYPLLSDLCSNSTNQLKERILGNLHTFKDKIVLLNNFKHYQFWIDVCRIFLQKAKLTQQEYVSLSDKKNDYSFMDLLLADQKSALILIKYSSSKEIVDFFSQISQEQRNKVLQSLSTEVIEIVSDQRFRDLQHLNHSIAFQLVSELVKDVQPWLYLLPPQPPIDLTLFYSVVKMRTKCPNNPMLDELYQKCLKSKEILRDKKQLLYVLNQGNLTIDTQHIQSMLLECGSCVQQMDLEDIQRFLHLLQSIPISEDQYSVFQIPLEKQINKQIVHMRSNKLSSIFYLYSLLNRKFNQNTDKSIKQNTNKTILLMEQKIIQNINEFTGNRLFLIFKSLEFIHSSSNLKQLIDKKIQVQLNLYIYIYQKGHLQNFLPELINFTANRIKQDQSVRDYQEHIRSICSTQPTPSPKVIQELSNLVQVVGKYELTQTMLHAYYKSVVVDFEGSGQAIHNTHVHYFIAAFLHMSMDVDRKIILDQLNHEMRDFVIVRSLLAIVQAQHYDCRVYSILKEKCLSHHRQMDFGVLCLFVFVASLDRDAELMNHAKRYYSAEIMHILEQQVPMKPKDQKLYNQDLAHRVQDIHFLQLYQSAIFFRRFQGSEWSNQIVDKLQNKIQNTTIKEYSGFESNVREILLTFLKKDQIIEEFNSIPPFKLDFYIPSLGVSVECNGPQHYIAKQMKRSDQLREEYLNARGIKLIQLNAHIWNDLNDRAEYLKSRLCI